MRKLRRHGLHPAISSRKLVVAMDCDDVLLLLASPSEVHSSEEDSLLVEHTSQCESCFELHRQLAMEGEQVSEPEDELIGQGIGPYRIRKLIGSGGMGRVYLAVHPEIESRVAIKVFSKDWNAYPKLVARFFAEAHATNLIAHENIVNVFDVGRLEDGRPYMVMEHLPGWPLSRLIGSETLTDASIGQVMLDVLSALAAAHEHEIVHRDLKPDNIFVSPEGRATLLDFGIAKLIPRLVGDSAPTATGTILGTPHYMSPEQATGDPVDLRTDVYAMGIILYECFTGRRPFQGGSLYRLMDQHVNCVPTSPSDIRPGLSEDVEAVILKAMAKDIGSRFSSIAEMRMALAGCPEIKAGPSSSVSLQPAKAVDAPRLSLTAETVPARPNNQETLKPQVSSGKTRVLIGAGLVGIMGLAIFFGASGMQNEPRLAQVPVDIRAEPLAVAAADAATTSPDASPIGKPDAASRSAVAPLPKPKPKPKPLPKPKPKSSKLGIAPLAMLGAAQESARANAEDAVLFRISVSGINRDGRIELATGAIEFDFVSANLVQLTATRGRDTGRCIIRVRYSGSKTADVQRRSGKCAKLRTLAPPRCTIAKLLGKGRAAGSMPAASSATSATLQVSRGKHTGRPFWRIEDSAGSYKLPGC